MELISKDNKMYNNGNKLIINFKTLNSKSNQKRIASENKHVITLLHKVICWMVMGKLTFHGACVVGLILHALQFCIHYYTL